jgi:hypothetical protein
VNAPCIAGSREIENPKVGNGEPSSTAAAPKACSVFDRWSVQFSVGANKCSVYSWSWRHYRSSRGTSGRRMARRNCSCLALRNIRKTMEPGVQLTQCLNHFSTPPSRSVLARATLWLTPRALHTATQSAPEDTDRPDCDLPEASVDLRIPPAPTVGYLLARGSPECSSASAISRSTRKGQNPQRHRSFANPGLRDRPTTNL